MAKAVDSLPQEPGPAAAAAGTAALPTADSVDGALLTVLVPVYNEAQTIDELLKRVLAAPYPMQVVVVDDGSTDGTAARLAAWESESGVEVWHHPTNRGKGAAIRTGLEHARGRFTIIQDADLEYDPGDYPRLIEPLRSGQAQVVYGSRALDEPGQPRRKRNWCLFRFGVKLLNLCLRMVYGVRLTDEATCYKAFPTAALRDMQLECERFEFCPEVTAKACRMGLQITEVPIRYQPRSFDEGKKIRWTDGLQAFATLWRWRKWRPAEPLAQQAGVDRQRRYEGAASSDRRKGGFTLVELLVVVTIIAMLMSLLLPAVMSARGAARRLQCMNNLHNLSLAMIGDADANRRYAANGYFATDGMQHFSWVVELLPFLERRDIAERWDRNKPWQDPKNLTLGSMRIAVLVCPDDPTTVPNQGNLNYVVNSGIGWTSDQIAKDCPMCFHRISESKLMEPIDLNGDGVTCPRGRKKKDATPSDKTLLFQMGLFFAENWPRGKETVRFHTPDTVLDGLSNTLMLSESIHVGYESVHGTNWSTPMPRYNSFIYSAYICKDSKCSAGNVDYGRANDRSQLPYRREAINGDRDQAIGEAPWASSYHPGGVFVAFCDGRVQFMSEDIYGGVYAALMSPQGTLITGPLAQPGPEADEYLR